MLLYVIDLHQSVQMAIREYRPTEVPGFGLPKKGITPFLAVYREGIFNGQLDVKVEIRPRDCVLHASLSPLSFLLSLSPGSSCKRPWRSSLSNVKACIATGGGEGGWSVDSSDGRPLLPENKILDLGDAWHLIGKGANKWSFYSFCRSL